MTKGAPIANPKKRGRPFAESTVGDVTRSKRAKEHLERLDEAKGKRLVVDLDAGAAEALGELLSSGYAETQKGVVIKALLAASSSLEKKS